MSHGQNSFKLLLSDLLRQIDGFCITGSSEGFSGCLKIALSFILATPIEDMIQFSLVFPRLLVQPLLKR